MYMYKFWLIGSLIIGSGVIAFLGDYLGRYLGKRRLTLFGMRPRHTAMAISVATGITILLITLGVVSALSSEARTALFRMDKLQRKLQTLKTQNELLERQSAQTLWRLERTSRWADKLNKEVAKKVAELRKTNYQLMETKAEVARLVDEQKRLSAEVKKINIELRNKSVALKDTNEKLSDANRSLALARENIKRAEETSRRMTEQIRRISGERRAALFEQGQLYDPRLTEVPPIYQAQEVVAAKVISGKQEKVSIATQLLSLLRQAHQAALERGAVAPKGERAVKVEDRWVVLPSSSEPRRLKEPDVLNLLVDIIKEAGESLLVEVYACRSTAKEEQVPVDFRLIRNRLVFRKGEVLARRQVDGNESLSSMFRSIVEMLGRDVRDIASARGLRRQMGGSLDSGYGQVSYEEILQAVEKIKEKETQTIVEACAKDDTYTAGPLQVVFRIGSF